MASHSVASRVSLLTLQEAPPRVNTKKASYIERLKGPSQKAKGRKAAMIKREAEAKAAAEKAAAEAAAEAAAAAAEDAPADE